MPRFNFLKRVAVSRLTQPLAVLMALPLWFLLVPDDVSLWGGVCGFVPVALSMWLIRELNVRCVLLRINSKMLSSTFIVLMGFAVPLHTLCVGNVVAVGQVLVYLMLFSVYQIPRPVPVFLAFVIVSLMTMATPGLVFFVPVYLLVLILLRVFNLRTVLASFFGILMPYWIVLGVLYVMNGAEAVADEIVRITSLHFFDYTEVSLEYVLFPLYFFVILLVGFVEMSMSNYADKVRVKVLYQIVSYHGFIALILLATQLQLYHEIVAMLVVDAAIMGGHCVAQNYKQASHLFFILALILGLAVAVVSAK